MKTRQCSVLPFDRKRRFGKKYVLLRRRENCIVEYVMNILLFFFHCLLSATQAWGGVAVCILFLLCFVVVHAVKLSCKGLAIYKEEQSKQPNEESQNRQGGKEGDAPRQKPRQSAPAPVYYLVEKKRVKKKPSAYDEPRRIRFEEEER